ncbi:MAG: bifunctional oligoribonuclease/PAP phosphatase NrnA [Bacteroidota bacterium]|nr:bifunctional oligoribonuclease/PAP phosphatase NrnA [Bacteroidota bacterium]
MNKTELDKLRVFLSSPKKIVITTHKGPDGDAMGSSLALYNYMIKKDHQVDVITPNAYPDFLKWMKGNDKVIVYESYPQKAAQKTHQADIIFCLDFNTISRIDTYGPVVESAQCPKVIIDHHQDPDTFEFNFSNPSACSTAQLIYEFFELMGDLTLIDRDIAECIYAGIMTDTGNFRFNSVTAKTHQITAHLLQIGVRNDLVYDQIQDNNSLNRIQLLGFCLSEKLVVLDNLGVAYISLSQNELNRFKFQKGDTEGVVNYALSIKGITLAAFFVERDGIIKISFRSKGNVSVNKLAKDHFGGGGHINAAGGSFNNMPEAIDTFCKVVTNYI